MPIKKLQEEDLSDPTQPLTFQKQSLSKKKKKLSTIVDLMCIIFISFVFK